MVLANSYRLILSDINLPDCSGRELVAKLRNLCPDTELKIIASTCHGSAMQRRTYLNDGFDDYLAKSFTKDILTRLLASWMPS